MKTKRRETHGQMQFWGFCGVAATSFSSSTCIPNKEKEEHFRAIMSDYSVSPGSMCSEPLMAAIG